MFPILIWVVIIAAIFGSMFYAHQLEKKRRESIFQLAEELGLEYRESLSEEDARDFGNFALALKGRHSEVSNVIVADSGELRMVIFDFSFTVGSGKNKQTHRQTVVFARDQNLQLPLFSVSPESFFHKLENLVGKDDIDFDDDSDFSNSFLLYGEDEGAVRELFDASRRKAMLGFQDVCVEGQLDHFILYRKRKRRDAQTLKDLMGEALNMNRLLQPFNN